MRILATLLMVLSALGLASPALAPSALAQARPVVPQQEVADIGSWHLACQTDPMTDKRGCTLRLRNWIVPPKDDQPGVAFEALQRDGAMLPAVTIRDLTAGTAIPGLLALTATVQLRFGGDPAFDMPCRLEGKAIICVPAPADATRAVQGLLAAQSVLIRFRASLPLPTPGPEEPVALDLADTKAALDRLRAGGGATAPAPAEPGLDLRGLIEQLLRDFFGRKSPAGTDRTGGMTL